MKIVLILFLIGFLYGALFFLIDRLEKKEKLSSELIRKILHIGSGLIALLFPLFFHTLMGVVYLGVFFIVVLLVLRNLKRFKSGIGKALRKDDRESRGDIYFIVSIVLLWVFSYSNRVLYYIPLLILIFADALAALGGIKYGKRKYKSVVGEKSIEGSGIFFIVTLSINLIILLIFTDIEIENIVLISVLMSFLSMILEAISWRGLDNLFVPLLCFFILKSSMESNTSVIGINLFVTIILFLIVIFGKKYVALSDDAALAGAFYTYFVWIIGGLSWTTATVFLYFIYRSVTVKPNFERQKPYDFPIIMTICLPGLFWLLTYRITHIEEIFNIYLTVMASHLSIVGVARMRYSNSEIDFKRVILINSFIGISYLTILMIIFSHSFEKSTWLFCVATVFLSTLIFNVLQPVKENYLLNTNRLIKHGLTVFFCSFIVLIPFWINNLI